MRIEIKGVQFANKGAALMLQAVLEQLQQRLPQAQIVLSPGPLSPYTDRARLGAWQKLSVRKNLIDLNAQTYWLPQGLRKRLMNQWGMVTEAEIDATLDASGFAYGDQWGSLQIRHLAGEISRHARRGKPYIFLPQAFGPFTRQADINNLQRSLPLASRIYAREQTSLDSLKLLIGEGEPLRLCNDFTNLVKGSLPEYLQDAQDSVLVIPNANMLSQKNPDARWRQSYIPLLVKMIHRLQKQGVKVQLLNHEGKADAAICQQIQDALNDKVPLIVEADPLYVKGIIGAAKAVICSRFHGCVSALSQGVPCLGTSWSHKYEHLFAEYGCPQNLLSPTLDDNALNNTVEALLNGELAVSDTQLMQLRQNVQAMWDDVFSLLGQSAI